MVAEKTVQAALLARAAMHPERTAFNYYRDGWKKVSHGQFIKAAEAAALSLSHLGVAKGDRVAIISGNGPRWCSSYLGILLSGAVAVPADVRTSPGEIRNILVHSGAKAAVHSEETLEAVKMASEGLGLAFLNLDSISEAGAEAGLAFSSSSDGAHGDDPASLLYTSGTTGEPKGVVLTHRNLLSDAEAVIKLGIVTEGDNVLSMLPLHHTYPFMCTFLVPLLVGGTVTYPPGLKGPEIVSAVKDREVTVIVAVPQILELMRNRMFEKVKGLPWPIGRVAIGGVRLAGFLRRRFGVNFMKGLFGKPFGSQLRFFACGGARLEPGVMRDMEALGFTVVEGYGLTETSPVVTFNPPERRKPGSAGVPVPTAEIRIISDGEAPAGAEGEVVVKGPMVMKGYYNNPVATSSAMREEWFLSGDLGYLDPEGYLFITGRKKEVIVLASGKNVYPEEVENHYLRSPLIKEICVLQSGGRLQAVVVPDASYARQHNIGNINDALRWEINGLSRGLPPHMRVMGYALHHAPLPRTPLGKLRRFMVRDAASGAGAQIEDEPALMADDVGRVVARLIKELLAEPPGVCFADSLELDLGLDSLKRLELAVSLEEAFGVSLPEELFFELQSVGEVVEKIRELRSAEGPAPQGVAGGEPTDEEKRGVGLERGGLQEAASRLGVGFFKVIFKLLFRLEARGLENLPEAPCIIAANHASYLDGFAMAASVPSRVFRTLYFQGLRRYFSGWLMSRVARLSHVIALDPAYFNRAMRLSAFVLSRGNSLCIFPEGGRSFDGSLMDFKKGIGILAVKLDVPVVPARIEGTFRILPRGAWLPRPGRIRVAFGRPFRASSLDMSRRPEAVDEFQFFADELRKRVAGLQAREH